MLNFTKHAYFKPLLKKMVLKEHQLNIFIVSFEENFHFPIVLKRYRLAFSVEKSLAMQSITNIVIFN